METKLKGLVDSVTSSGSDGDGRSQQKCVTRQLSVSYLLDTLNTLENTGMCT